MKTYRSKTAVSVLYREPKLLKESERFAAVLDRPTFQCSTVSRNC